MANHEQIQLMRAVSERVCNVPLNCERHINGHRVFRFADGFKVDGVSGMAFDTAVSRAMKPANEPIPFALDQFGNADV